MEQPRHFHLLSDEEIGELQPLMRVLRDERDAILHAWYERYLAHFGHDVTLPRAVFLELFARDLDAVAGNLLARDMEGFAADMRALAHELVERGVPFAELIASLHLFEESAGERFALAPEKVDRRLYSTFDKLSHCRIILLADSYFAGFRSDAATRVEQLESAAAVLPFGEQARSSYRGLVGASAAMARVYAQIAAAAGGRGAVLVCGESGTGKELVARAIHEAAGAPARPLIAVNCAALPRELIESELFGHRKGAYTGALSEHPGLIRSASSGTLFLDEITEMAIETQAKLLRVLEEHLVRPVGGAHELHVDVRFIASTNREPEAAVAQGMLRKDLFYRLDVHRVVIPPLRERLEDVPLLVAHFTRLLGSRGLRDVQGVEAEAIRVLRRYPFPGNVRELRSAIEYALSIGKGPLLLAADLPQHILASALLPARPEPPTPLERVPTLEEAERALIMRALEATSGNKLRAAQMMGISRHRLYSKLRKYGLESP